MKIQPNANSSEGAAISIGKSSNSVSDSFAGLENFGSFMVSESFNDDLRIKECRDNLITDQEQLKENLKKV